MNIMFEGILGVGFIFLYFTYNPILQGLKSVLARSGRIPRVHAEVRQFAIACSSIKNSCAVMAGILIILCFLNIIVPLPLFLIGVLYYILAVSGVAVSLYKGWQWRRELDD